MADKSRKGGSMGGEQIGKVAKEPKYRELEHTLDGLHTVVRRFDGLIAEMDNGPGPKDAGETCQPSSIAFQSVYDAAPNRIQEATSALEKTLSDLRSRLF